MIEKSASVGYLISQEKEKEKKEIDEKCSGANYYDQSKRKPKKRKER